MARTFYDPTPEHISKIGGPWCASFSGGKDSTSLVTWLEWCRRAGWIDAPRPALVMSDTEVEYETLGAISADMMALLRRSGWECAVVTPRAREKLYNRILGVGNMPIHAGIRRMRWCTRSTKIDPMERWRDERGRGLTLTGLRMGESAIRDGKILKRAGGCQAGGECGIPDPGERTYSPLLNWTTCQVIDWLNGAVGPDIRALMADVFEVTRRLVAVYGVAYGTPTFNPDFGDREITAARFGCVGCPAITAEAHAPASVVARHGPASAIGELYGVWHEARRYENRCWKRSKRMPGPVRMEARKLLFDRVMDIQRRAGIVLVGPEDEAFIRDCWARKVYPRGWSEADEATPPPADPLFPGEG